MTRLPTTSRMGRSARRGTGGFTLLELLVTISVIVVLVGIVATVGLGALTGQKAAQTRGTLNALDRALEEYYLAVGSFPRYRPADYIGRPGVGWDYVNEAFNMSDNQNVLQARPAFHEDMLGNAVLHPRKPSAGVFVSQARGIAESDAILASLSQDLFQITPRGAYLNQAADSGAVTVLDGWSVPRAQWEAAKRSGGISGFPAVRQSYIIYVHPENTTAQSIYGDCLNGRPYFMSAGPDRLCGLGDEISRGITEADSEYRARVEKALDDNLYSYPVGPPDRSTDVYQTLRLP